jgi:hypothetical protein
VLSWVASCADVPQHDAESRRAWTDGHHNARSEGMPSLSVRGHKAMSPRAFSDELGCSLYTLYRIPSLTILDSTPVTDEVLPDSQGMVIVITDADSVSTHVGTRRGTRKGSFRREAESDGKSTVPRCPS